MRSPNRDGRAKALYAELLCTESWQDEWSSFLSLSSCEHFAKQEWAKAHASNSELLGTGSRQDECTSFLSLAQRGSVGPAKFHWQRSQWIPRHFFPDVPNRICSSCRRFVCLCWWLMLPWRGKPMGWWISLSWRHAACELPGTDFECSGWCTQSQPRCWCRYTLTNEIDSNGSESWEIIKIVSCPPAVTVWSCWIRTCTCRARWESGELHLPRLNL